MVFNVPNVGFPPCHRIFHISVAFTEEINSVTTKSLITNLSFSPFYFEMFFVRCYVGFVQIASIHGGSRYNVAWVDTDEGVQSKSLSRDILVISQDCY